MSYLQLQQKKKLNIKQSRVKIQHMRQLKCYDFCINLSLKLTAQKEKKSQLYKVFSLDSTSAEPQMMRHESAKYFEILKTEFFFSSGCTVLCDQLIPLSNITQILEHIANLPGCKCMQTLKSIWSFSSSPSFPPQELEIEGKA